MTSKKTKPIWAEEISGKDFHVGNLVINNLSKNRRAMWDWKKDIINHATTRKTFLSWTDKKTWQQYSIMRLSGQFQVCFFFLQKNFMRKKTQANNQQNNTKATSFCIHKNFQVGESCLFCILVFFMRAKYFLKKNRLETVLITSFY